MTTFILADGFPVQLIFFAFVALIVVVSSVLGKSAEKPTPRVPLGGADAEAARQRAELQRRAEAHRQNVGRRQGPPVPPPLPQQMGAPQQSGTPRGRQSKSSRKSAARAAAAAAAAAAVPVAHAVPVARPAVVPESAAPAAQRAGRTVISSNVRLMLQRGAVREAMVLAEVLGPPKSLRDEA